MAQKYLLLMSFVLLIACDNTEKNKRLIQGEWVVDSLSEYPHTIVPNDGRLDRASRVLFDSQGNLGVFLTDTTKRSVVYYYSISNSRLTVWVGDAGIQYEIETLSNEILTIKRSFAGITGDDLPSIRMIKAH